MNSIFLLISAAKFGSYLETIANDMTGNQIHQSVETYLFDSIEAIRLHLTIFCSDTYSTYLPYRIIHCYSFQICTKLCCRNQQENRIHYLTQFVSFTVCIIIENSRKSPISLEDDITSRPNKRFAFFSLLILDKLKLISNRNLVISKRLAAEEGKQSRNFNRFLVCQVR